MVGHQGQVMYLCALSQAVQILLRTIQYPGDKGRGNFYGGPRETFRT